MFPLPLRMSAAFFPEAKEAGTCRDRYLRAMFYQELVINHSHRGAKGIFVYILTELCQFTFEHFLPEIVM